MVSGYNYNFMAGFDQRGKKKFEQNIVLVLLT